MFLSETEEVTCFVETFLDPSKSYKMEVPIYNRSVDLVIKEENDTLFAIEFKLNDWKSAISQIEKVSIVFDFLSICLIKPMRLSTQKKIIETCRDKGIGLFFFDPSLSTFINPLPPTHNTEILIYRKKMVLEMLEDCIHEN